MAGKPRATPKTRKPAAPPRAASLGKRHATVLFGDIPAGEIEERSDGVVTFRYLPAYLARPDAEPVSLTLPLSTDVVETIGLHPFFDGLIPEGWLLDIAARNWKLDPRDRVGLLLNLCSECIGAVRVVRR
jgi:serine/threonine-protein kinase HipA